MNNLLSKADAIHRQPTQKSRTVMAKRPYFNSSTADLKSAIERHRDNPVELGKIIEEIGFRKKTKNSLADHLIKAKRYVVETKSPKHGEKQNLSTPVSADKTSAVTAPTSARGSHATTNTSYEEDLKPETPIILGKPGKIRKASNSLKNLPQVWSPEVKKTFAVRGLDKAKTNVEKFICAIAGLVWEIRKNAKFTKTINLTNGRREKTFSGEYGYLYGFLYDGDEEFFEGARIDFQTGPKKTKGSIVSIRPSKPRTIIISLEEDFGDLINHCSLTQDEAALLEALQKRFEVEIGLADKKSGLPVGMNSELADLLLSGGSQKINPDKIGHIDTSELNRDQGSFVHKAVNHSVSFLWGPPGTGKTQTLAALCDYFYKMDEKTLICSNTNQAVDQVLLKLCKKLKDSGQISELEDGKIVRLGRISQTELLEDYSSYVTIDGIAERKGAEITLKISELEKAKVKSENELLKRVGIADGFEKLAELKSKLATNAADINRVERELVRLAQDQKTIETKLVSLENEKLDVSSKGFFGRAFSRSIDTINSDIRSLSNERIANEKKQKTTKTKIVTLEENQKQYPALVSKLENALSTEDISANKQTIDKLELELSELNAELAILKKQIEDLRKSILSSARVIGTTLTKCFLSPTDVGKFRNVIIDEASMGLIPTIYFAVTQAEQRCIISGDFRQLPPIVQSENADIVDIIGGTDNDIFKRTGFEEKFEQRIDCAFSEMLRTQYRMDPKICDLISEIGYAGQLVTANSRQGSALPFPGPVVIIDTSSLYPFTDRDPFGSTSNTLHALIARNLMRELTHHTGANSVGYCAPFKAQVKLLKKMTIGEPFENDVSIGTVHTFQGDEKSTIIFDTVNSIGERHFINPNLAQELPSKSNILTVAVSRAKDQLIFIANLRYLDTKIPAMGYLRKILYQAQQTGAVISAERIIDLAPILDDLEKWKIDFHELSLSEDALKRGLVNEDVFFPLVKEDISRARKYIAIYSGFYTASRVGDLLPLLSKKIREGLKVRVIVPPPSRNGSLSEADSNLVFEKLESIGILVEFRARIHQKAVLIDDDIVWFGSLNPLSFSGATEESMLRDERPGITGTFAANMAVNRGFAKEDPSLIAEKEIPDCSTCQGKTVFNRGQYGPWLLCLKCGAKETPRNF